MLNPTKNYHILVTGVSGCGKSTLINKMIQHLLTEPNTMLGLIDPKMNELYEYRNNPKTQFYADDEDSIYDALRFTNDVVMDRNRRSREQEMKYSTEPTMFVFVDEMAPLMQSDRKKEYIRMFNRITLLGRSAHVYLVLCTQVATRDVIPNCIRDNMDNKVCLKQSEAYKYSYFLGERMPELILPRDYGYAYIKTASLSKPVKIKVDELWDNLSA